MAEDHAAPQAASAFVDPLPEAGPRWEPESQEELDTFLALVDEGVADSDAGRVISGGAIFRWMDSWFTEDELSPPQCGD